MSLFQGSNLLTELAVVFAPLVASQIDSASVGMSIWVVIHAQGLSTPPFFSDLFDRVISAASSTVGWKFFERESYFEE